jgi:hypothetical protein
MIVVRVSLFSLAANRSLDLCLILNRWNLRRCNCKSAWQRKSKKIKNSKELSMRPQKSAKRCSPGSNYFDLHMLLQGRLTPLRMLCTQAEVALDQESNETAKLLETLKGKGGEVANRLAEMQVMHSTMRIPTAYAINRVPHWLCSLYSCRSFWKPKPKSFRIRTRSCNKSSCRWRRCSKGWMIVLKRS